MFNHATPYSGKEYQPLKSIGNPAVLYIPAAFYILLPACFLFRVHDSINPHSKREWNMGRKLIENCFPFNRASIISKESPHHFHPPLEFFWKNGSLGLVVGAVGSLVGMSVGLQLVPFRKP